MSPFKLRKLLLSALFLYLPFNSTSLLANELLNAKSRALLVAESKNYREHDDRSEDGNDPHSISHDWKNHYHVIRSVRLKKNGNLKIRFCEKVELLEGQVYAGDVKYDVKDAYKIRKRSITWRLKKKGTFKKGTTVFVNTQNFLGRPTEKSPNLNEIRSLERGCGLPFIYLPPGVEVSDNSSALGLMGLVVGIGIAAGAGGSGSGSSSSN